MNRKGTFLSAEWRHLAMLNYEVDPDLLLPYVPAGTELDMWHGRTYVSIVGFQFLQTRLLGLSIPLHTDFEEVNLRFYVRRRGPEGWRRGVVFIKELVPKQAIALVARLAYNENYAALPMRHSVQIEGHNGNTAVQVAYRWRLRHDWQGIWVQAQGQPQPMQPGSEEEFIAEHYWGYSAQRDGSSLEYRVEHPPWRIWQVSDYAFDGDVAALYGPQFVAPLQAQPTSVFLAEGSAVTVAKGVPI